MPVPAESPFRTTRAERRVMLAQHFLQAIEPILEGTPYADLSVERIIKAGKISRTSFYAYYEDKVDLLLAMTDSVVADLRAVAFWRLPDEATKDDLREALQRIIDVYRAHRVLLRSVVEGAAYDARLRAAYGAFVDRGVANVAAHVEAGKRAGTIAPDISPRGTARVLVTMAERSLYELIGVQDADDEALLGPLTDVFWRTLYEGYR